MNGNWNFLSFFLSLSTFFSRIKYTHLLLLLMWHHTSIHTLIYISFNTQFSVYMIHSFTQRLCLSAIIRQQQKNHLNQHIPELSYFTHIQTHTHTQYFIYTHPLCGKRMHSISFQYSRSHSHSLIFNNSIFCQCKHLEAVSAIHRECMWCPHFPHNENANDFSNYIFYWLPQ